MALRKKALAKPKGTCSRFGRFGVVQQQFATQILCVHLHGVEKRPEFRRKRDYTNPIRTVIAQVLSSLTYISSETIIDRKIDDFHS